MTGETFSAETVLKPCPFCGQADPILQTGDWYVVCRKCGSEGPWNGADADLAIAAWNTRATPQPPLLEELQEALEPLIARLDDYAATAKRAVADSQGLADHKLIILANYGDLALQLAPAFRTALTHSRQNGEGHE